MKRMKQLGMLWFAAVICLTAMMALPRSASALTDAEQIVGVQVAPVDVPLGEAVVPQDLSDALSAQTGDGCALDMEKLRELFDVDADVDALHVQAAGWRGEYSAAPSTTGAFEIDARSRYILIELIESERKMVQWAGVVAPGEAPRSLFSCSMQAPSDDALEIDISKVVEAYGDVELQIADEGKAYALCPTDDGVARIAMKGKPKYVFIRREADGRQPYLWAARFDEPVRCALEPAGEVEPDASALSWSISIGEMDARRIPLTFDAGNGTLPLPWAQVRLTYVDAAGEVLREEQISATEFSSIGSYTHEPQMPKGTSSVRASVYLDGEAVCEAEAGLSLPVPDPALNAPQPSGETGRPKPEPSPTPAIVLEMEATATPEPAVELRIADNPAVAYDGKAHAPEIEVRTARAQAAYSYAPVGAGGALPAQDDWQSGLPEATEAGTHEWWIRAEAKGREIEYQDAKGEKLNARSGCVRVKLEILPAELQIELSAEQIGQAVYDGREQTLRFRYDASVKRDESGCFDLQTVLSDARWRKEGELVRTDAGEYPVEPEAGTVEFLDALRDELSPNYKAEWAWKPSNVQLLKKPVALTSDSAATVYGAEDWPLKAGGVEGLDGFVEGDLYNSDVVAIGEQSAAGVGENGIWVNEDLQHNYRLEIRPGALVVFPQSLDGDAPEWNAQDGAARAREWAEASPEEMPGYYLGMRVELERSRAPYDGAPKQILPRFSDANGAPIHLEMEKDYSLRFLRNGVETDDLTNAGELAVEIRGMGNYAGTVERTFTIEPLPPEDTSVALESWEYDGEPAGSEAHPIHANGAERFVYRNADGETIDAPRDAGKYSVVAIWTASGAESQPLEFEIYPAEVDLTFRGGQLVDVDDERGLFDEDRMLRWSDGEPMCTDANFKLNLHPLHPIPELESWEYDGEAADSAAHPVRNADGAKLSYLDAEGAQIDERPRDAGKYSVVATYVDGGAEEAEFEIRRKLVNVRAERAEKRWGEDDPEFGAQVEGLIAGEEVDLDYEMTRQKGEALGEYAIVPQGEEIQGNYELIFEPGVLEIVPQDIGAAALEWFGEAPVLSAPDGGLLEPDADYRLEVDLEAGEAHVRAEGMGNFTGQAEWDCAPGPLEPELVLTDEAGVELTTLRTDAAGELNALGRVALNAPVRPERLRVWINGEILDETLTPDGEGLCRFELTGVALEPAETVEIALKVDGEIYGAWSFPQIRHDAYRIWLLAGVALTLAALVSLMICVRLSRRLKRERDQLLDRITRQSNRSIRENRDEPQGRA